MIRARLADLTCRAAAIGRSVRIRTRLLPLGLVLVPALGLSLPAAAEPAAADTTGVIDTAEAWEHVAQARDAAAGDRHHDAVADYLAALAKDGRLVQVVAQEIAYQKLWREDADQAVFYFRRYLARHPDQDNRDVRSGLALAYSWSGRQAEAIVLYRQLATEDPSDGGARVGLARTLIWNNQLHEGWRELRGVEDEFPLDSAAGAESRNFALTVLDSYTPTLDVSVTASFDSDDLDIWRLSAVGAVTVLGNQLLQIMPGYALYRHPDHADLRAPRLGLGLVGALRHNWSYHLYGWLDLFTSAEPLFGRTEKLDWQRPGGDFWLTWLPAARWRIDFGGTSQAVETYYALDQHLHYEQANLSADWRFARRWTLTAAGNLADYSDGNSKRRGALQLFWKREGRVTVTAGPSLTYMDFSDPYPGGYWAPDWVRNGSFTVRLNARTRTMTFAVDGSVGTEKEPGSEAITVGGLSGRIGWRLGPDVLLAVQGGHSQSRFSSAGGYKRTFVGLSLRAMF